MKWSMDHVLTWGHRRDTLKVSSGSVVMKTDAKVCFPRWPSGGHIWSPIGPKFGINVDCI
jgi:hypothetical protein